jgi:signal transduction histidine kinase
VHQAERNRRRWGRIIDPRCLFPLIAVILLGVVWSATFAIISVNDAAAAHAAAASTLELLDTYEAQVVRALSGIDQTLNLIKFWPQRSAKRTLADLEDKGLLPPDLLFIVSIADRSGVIVDSTRPIGRQNISDQDYFRKQRESDGFAVGRPPPGPAGEDAQLTFSRRLTGSNGAFDGIAIVSVDAAYFVSGYNLSKLGEHGVLSMIGTDGISLLRRTGNAMFSGEPIEYAAAAADPDAIDKDAAVSTSSWDGMRRWTSARELYGFPLAVLAGLSVDEQMAAAHRHARVCAWWAALASALVVALTTLLGRMSWRLQQSGKMFKLMAESTHAIPFTLDLTHGRFTYIGAQAIVDWCIPGSEWNRPGALDAIIPRETNPEIRQSFDECASGPFEFVAAFYQRSDRRTEVQWTGTCETTAGAKYLRGLMLDITELRRLGRELASAQKLESVGRLAAGVAHEINTPVQFVTDNTQFLRTAIADVAAVVHAYRELRGAVESAGDAEAAARLAVDAEKAADFDYIMKNMAPAIESSLEGLGRIATIVRSMKEFAHPDQAEKTLADLNQAIRSTLVIAHNEYKFVAEIDAKFGDLPPVQCYLGEINQVVLNLLMNASHAISDVVKDTGKLGKITVRTRLDGEEVEISIADTGSGIPEKARDKVFDPFFTTKEVGKGTGQGLAISHSIIAKKHGGTLHFTTGCGEGTTFFIRLPIDARSHSVGTRPIAAMESHRLAEPSSDK